MLSLLESRSFSWKLALLFRRTGKTSMFEGDDSDLRFVSTRMARAWDRLSGVALN